MNSAINQSIPDLVDTPKQSGRQPLVHGFIWMLLGNGLYAACQWSIWLILARLGSPVIVGQYSLAQATVIPIVQFSQLQLRSIQATDTYGRVRFGEYLSLRYLTTITALMLVGLAAFANAPTAVERQLILLVGLARCIESMSDVYYGHLQATENMARISKSLIAKGILSVITVGLALWATKSLLVALLWINATWFCLFLFYDRRLGTLSRSQIHTALHFAKLLNLARLAMPLGITMLFLSLYNSIPRYFLYHLSGAKELGVFSVLASVQTAGTVIVAAVGQAVTPRLSTYYVNRQKPEFRSLVFRLLLLVGAVGTVFIAVVALWGDLVIGTVFGRLYAGQHLGFVLLSVSATLGFLVSVLGYVATASQQLSFQPWACLAMTAVTGLACAVLVPKFGVPGAATAMIIGTFLALFFYGRSFVKVLQADTTSEQGTYRAEFSPPDSVTGAGLP